MATDSLITINTQLLLSVGADHQQSTVRHLDLEPKSWRVLVADLKSFLQSSPFHGKCLICDGNIDASDDSEEHIVLQGLGIKWGKLPPKIICKPCNNGCSDAESRFLKLGFLGALRPFYVGAKKEVVFGDGESREITLRNDPEDGFKILLKGVDLRISPKETGPGKFSIKIMLKEAATIHSSRALHKMAYLALVTVHPNLALSKGFDPVRNLIRDGAVEDYRPYSESFVSAAPPGVNIRFMVTGNQDEMGNVTLSSVQAALRIHHCYYGLSLAGQYPESLSVGRYMQNPVPEGTRPAEIEFGFDSLSPHLSNG